MLALWLIRVKALVVWHGMSELLRLTLLVEASTVRRMSEVSSRIIRVSVVTVEVSLRSCGGWIALVTIKLGHWLGLVGRLMVLRILSL